MPIIKKKNSLALITLFVFQLCWINSVQAGKTGDINDDNDANIQDVVYLINLVLSPQDEIPHSVLLLADVTGDNQVNIQDVVYLINLVLNPPIQKPIQKESTTLTTSHGGQMRISLYYQEEQVKKPTLYFVAGGATDHQKYEHLLHHMVKQGYAVIAASYASFNSENISDNFFEAFVKGWEMSKAKGINDDTRVGLIGHSSGAGTLPSLAYEFFVDQGMGSNGRFVFGATPWVDFQWQNNMALPIDTNFVTQWYDNDHGTDPRIYLDMYRHMGVNHKTFITVKNADHGTIKKGQPLVIVEQAIYAPLVNLANYTFNGTSKESIFPVTDVDNTYMHILAEGTVPSDVSFQAMMSNFTGNFPCDSAHNGTFAPNPRKAECEAYGRDVPEKKYPITTTLSPRATDNTVLKPAEGASVVDDIFGTTTTRINKSDTHISSYPKVQSWNIDASLLHIGHRLYDASSLEETDITKGKESGDAYNTLCANASGYFRWSNKVANRFFVIDSHYRFVQGEINGNSVDCSNKLDLFDEYEQVHIGPYEGNIDYDDKYVVFAAKKPNDSALYIILFDIPNKKRMWTKVLPDDNWESKTDKKGKTKWSPKFLDWISVSPSGKYILVNNRNKGNFQEGMYRYDIDFSNAAKLQYDYNGTLYSEGGHGDIGFDAEGNEVLVQFLSGLGVYSFNLDNPAELGKELLTSPYAGGHVSCRNTQRKGWCYVITKAEGYRQVFALKLDGTGDENVQSFAQTHMKAGYSETYGAPNPDGTQVIFNSHWGDDQEIGTFIAEVE